MRYWAASIFTGLALGGLLGLAIADTKTRAILSFTFFLVGFVGLLLKVFKRNDVERACTVGGNMDQAKKRALKLFVQQAGKDAAAKFYELDGTGHGFGRCGVCPTCQESIQNLALLFRKSMERELVNRATADFERLLEERMEKEGITRDAAYDALHAELEETWKHIAPKDLN